MMEQPHAGKGHDNAVFVTVSYYKIIANRAAGLSNIAYTALFGAVNVIAKGKECVAAQGNAGNAVQVGALFFARQLLRLTGKVLLPAALG